MTVTLVITAVADDPSMIKKIVSHDFNFLILAMGVSLSISFTEVNTGNASLRGDKADEHVIVDTGYIATSKAHAWLATHCDWNDTFALLNTVRCVLLPAAYLVWVTIWVGDYNPAFRYLATQLLQSICRWFTCLPFSPDHLMSYFDDPNIFQCLAKNCGNPAKGPVQPFVSFFSGHIATMVCVANHMYLHGYRRPGIACHICNLLQIARLLSTRGHYKCDLLFDVVLLRLGFLKLLIFTSGSSLSRNPIIT